MFLPGHAMITSVACAEPFERVSTSDIFAQISSKYNLPKEYLERTTGIKEKRRSSHSDLPSDLAVRAANRALDFARIKSKEIDLIIYTGLIRDHDEPSTAHIVQHKLGIDDAISIDLSNACHGFANGIIEANTWIAAYPNINNVLIVTGEQGSRFEDRAVSILKKEPADKNLLRDLLAGLTLGDAGGAVIVSRKNEYEKFRYCGLIGFNCSSFGQHNSLCVAGEPLNSGEIRTQMAKLMDTAGPYVADMYHQFLRALDWQPSDISAVIIHQTGANLIKHYEKLLKVNESQIIHTTSTRGNLITAAIPVNLTKYIKNANNGDKVVFSVQGSGLTVSHTGLVWTMTER